MALQHSASVRSQQPALQQGGHVLDPREVLVDPLRIAAFHRLAVPVAGSGPAAARSRTPESGAGSRMGDPSQSILDRQAGSLVLVTDHAAR